MTARQYLDLVATMGLAGLPVLVLLVLGASPVTLLVALPLLLLLPGYAIVSALYPVRGSTSIGPVGRFALSIALSVAVTPAVAFVANYTVGVYARPVVVGVATVTISVAVVAMGRRAGVDPDASAGPDPLGRVATIADRYFHGSRSLRTTAPLEATSKTDVVLNLVVVGAILVFTASVGFAALVPQDAGVSEAYLATTSGENVTIVQDPSELSQAQRDSVVAVVENQEGHEQSYTVQIVAQDVTRTSDGVQVDGERELGTQSNTVATGSAWQVDVPPSDGDRTVVRVYQGQADSEPAYRLVLQE